MQFMQKTAYGYRSVCRRRRYVTKTLIVMKLTVFFLTAAFCTLHAAGLTQTISVTGDRLPFKDVLNEIRKQTGYLVFTNNNVFDITRPLDLSVEEMPLEEFLKVITRDQPVSFVIKDKTVILSRRPEIVAELDRRTKKQYAVASAATPIKGFVRDSTGARLYGATVTVKGTKRSAQTNERGEFSIEADEGDILQISFVGYVNQNVKIEDSQLLVILQRSESPLDNVQIVAYGTNTQRFNVGNVSTVTAKDIAKQPVNDPLLALHGRVPGMTINQTSGVQGSEVNVNIRGLNSLTAGAQPLFIIDGVPFAQNVLYSVGYGAQRGASALSFINPADIESISVLKDADATAIYGSRGANGVVLITTKKAKAGKTTIDVNVYYGSQSAPLNKMKLLNTQEYLKLRHEGFYNDSIFNPGADVRPTRENAPDLLIWDTTQYTDWKKFWIGNTAETVNGNITISGGTDLVQYMIGGSYNRQTTVFPGDFHSQNGNVRFMLNGVSPNQKLKVGLSGLYSFNTQEMPNRDFTEFAIFLPPNHPSFLKEDGSLNFAPDPTTGLSTMLYGMNPYGEVIGGNDNPSKTNNMVSNVNISYSILPGLDAMVNLGYNRLNSNPTIPGRFFFRDPAQGPYTATTFWGTASNESWILEPQLNFNRQLGSGRLLVLLGGTLQRNQDFGQGMQVEGITNEALVTNPTAGTSSRVYYATQVNYKYAALFSKINYILRDKYIVDLSIRRDGSSRFGDANKFAYFGAVGAGWIFSEENFLKENVQWLSFGKLRGSYGLTANDQIGDYQYLDRYEIITGESRIYQNVVGIRQVSLFNPNYEWEQTTKLEVGLEAGFFDDRILVNVSHYLNKSDNQLQGITLPSMVGATNVAGNIPATIENRGTEIVLTTENLRGKNISWRTSFNISFQKNKLLDYTGTDNRFKQLIGQSLSARLLRHYMGVDPQTGRYRFADEQGKAVFADQGVDPEAVSIDLAPEYFGGIDNVFTYKTFSLSIFFQYTKQLSGNSVAGAFSAYMPGKRYNQWSAFVANRWQKPGDITDAPRASQGSDLDNDYNQFLESDGYYVDASFIRCKNLALSWALPDDWLKRAFIKSCRLYMQAQNLFTITSYPGSDPETKNFYNIPPMRIWSAGLQFTM